MKRTRFLPVLAVLCLLALVTFLGAQDRPAPAEPAAPDAKPAPDKAPVLLKENTRLIDRTGRILCLRDDLGVGTVPRSVFQPNGELGYFILLENAELQKLEDQTRHGEREVRISGTVTEYRGQNFLLLTRVFVRRD